MKEYEIRIQAQLRIINSFYIDMKPMIKDLAENLNAIEQTEQNAKYLQNLKNTIKGANEFLDTMMRICEHNAQKYNVKLIYLSDLNIKDS